MDGSSGRVVSLGGSADGFGPGSSQPPVRRRPTTTSPFGVGRRESHDASTFYARFASPLISDDSSVTTPSALDEIWVGDARAMDAHGHITDGSVALVVTSPPYFAGKEYEEALGIGAVPADFASYLEMLHDVLGQCSEKLEPGGRIAVNVANLGRKPYRSLAGDVIDILERLGLLLRGEIIWQKSHAAGGSCAWGTYQRPGNPVLRDVTERIIVASKGRFDRAVSQSERQRSNLASEGTMTKDEFVDATVDLWDLPAESATRIGHPAPFPVELPRRLIELYTYRGDLVLDPFMGSGSTAVAAVRTGRHFVGFDTDAGYVEMARSRVTGERRALGGGSRPTGAGRVTVSAGRPSPLADDAGVEEMVRRGERAADLARRTIADSGFREIETDVAFRRLGITVDFRARDKSGGLWLFILSGAYSATRPGLRRADVMWRAIGEASVLHQARDDDGTQRRNPSGPLILLTTDRPERNSAGARALEAAQRRGPSGDSPVHDVIELLDPDDVERLRRYGEGEPVSVGTG